MSGSRIRLTGIAGVMLVQACGTGLLLRSEQADPLEPASIESTVFLIGDAGSPAPHEPVLTALGRQIRAAPARRVLVYMGDNVYPRGMPPAGAPDRKVAERRLLDQLNVGLETGTPTYLVPGNHDWSYMGPDGWNGIKRQGEFVEAHGRGLAHLLPRGGCPGPEVVDVGRHARLILLDTQWWVHEYQKPTDSTSHCPTYTEQQVIDSLEHALASAAPRDSVQEALPEVKDSLENAADAARKATPSKSERDSVERAKEIATDSLANLADTLVNRQVIVIGHHPLESGGQHGGYFGWKSQLFPLRRFASWLWIPLPGIGSIEPIARREGGTNQDLAGPLYARMRHRLEEAFKDHEPLAFAGGHDHDLQVLTGNHVHHVLVAGAGIFGHVEPVDFRPNTRFAAAVSGFMRLDFLLDGRVRLGVITVNARGEDTEAFAMFLK